MNIEQLKLETRRGFVFVGRLGTPINPTSIIQLQAVLLAKGYTNDKPESHFIEGSSDTVVFLFKPTDEFDGPRFFKTATIISNTMVNGVKVCDIYTIPEYLNLH